MPRRKTQKKAPKPLIEIPGLAVTAEMSKKEKEEQLEIFLKDFRYKVKHTLSTFRIEAARVKLRIRNLWDMQLQQIPSSLWDMTIKDFAAAGGTVESVLKRKEAMKDEIYMKIDQRVGKIPSPLTSITEEGSDEPLQQVEQATAVRKLTRAKRTTAARAASSAKVPAVRQSARASRSKFATPADRLPRGVWGPTPVVTPKFDPRLPVTPENIREMKAGERLMSVAGSPVKVTEGRVSEIGPSI
ncbi:borealin-like [Elysia marginata]|uniref:Borealin-like n=1 Tax=Elysia marginata TaxID=1093978 RepID=A0AAV4HQR8_9GAST|nr:borealin-like [Elysia marginata]